MNNNPGNNDRPVDKLSVTIVGKVQSIISPTKLGELEKAQIVFEKDHGEIRIENALNAAGHLVAMKVGDHVEITVRSKT
jgi:hypothetical protein